MFRIVPSLYFFLVQTLRLADFQQFSDYLPTAQQPPPFHVVLQSGAAQETKNMWSQMCVKKLTQEPLQWRALSPVDLETPIRNGAFDGNSQSGLQ